MTNSFFDVTRNKVDVDLDNTLSYKTICIEEAKCRHCLLSKALRRTVIIVLKQLNIFYKL